MKTLADNLKQIEEYPDISFIGDYTIDRLASDMEGWYKEKYEEETGEPITLHPGDERRIKLLACAYYIFQSYMMIDDAGKAGLLKYSRGDYIENLGALKGVARRPATGAHTTLRFTLQQTRTSATGIPAGTRATAGDNIYFQTDEYDEIPAVSLYTYVGATCLTT